MSGGVDSSVAAALLVEAGHDVMGATLKLWGGPSDSGCCSVADVDDARRVAQQLGIAHHVFDLSEEFEAAVVSPYVAAHASARTPNPCIECNRHIKFDRLLARTRRLGFDALATGHHARVERADHGSYRLLRGVDGEKDQSYVLSMLGQDQLSAVVLPVGVLTKAAVRARAAALGLRTAEKPDSQDVCFIASTEGRRGFLERRLSLRPGSVVDAASGAVVGETDAVELVTVGQRRGMGHGADGQRRYVVSVESTTRRVLVAGAAAALVERVALEPGSLAWADRPLGPGARAVAQVSAHGRPTACTFERDPTCAVVFAAAQRPVAPGQTIALYDADDPEVVVGSGIVA
jgi:tRNA-specific 2-thiouridylase